jgi:osmotically-inducible protein OsmY
MRGIGMTFIISAALLTFSCKGKDKDKDIDATGTNNTGRDVTGDTSTAPATTTTQMVTEDQLRDATKDFPGVTATVNNTNGEVTLTGTISRENLPKLMQAVQALNPTKVNNNLTIK